MDARSVVGSIFLVLSLVAACSARSSERGSAAGEDAAGARDPAMAAAGASAPAAEAPAAADQPAPDVDITWKLVPTR
ncbi:MAG TPA: hypothetical protein VNM90_16215, partial [Haliangium sp.]|nr:hypothetical protein [Haliangium sp.]